MTRLRIALVSLAVALSMFAPVAARPVAAEDSGLGLSDVVFAFDFSGSIYCYYKGKPIPPSACPDSNLNENLAAGVASLADKIEKFKTVYSDRAINFKVVRFGNGRTVPEKVSATTCNGNTKTSVQLLIDCLNQIAQDYRDPGKQLGGTNFVPSLNELAGISSRCGIILFTDGKPDDRENALDIRNDEKYKCAILPVGLIPENLTDEEAEKIVSKDLLDQLTKVSFVGDTCKATSDFVWETTVYTKGIDAADAIGKALDAIACQVSVPPPLCWTVAEYEKVLDSRGLIHERGAGVEDGQYPGEILPVPETKGSEGDTVVIRTATLEAPASCAPSPTPTPTPTPVPTEPPPPTPPCVADSPLSWLGCNPWALLLLLLLVGARLWWIGRDLQVSINGQEAVALRGGTKVGFDLHNGNAERTPNPNDAQVKITRAFFRFFPGTRLDTSGLTGEVGGKPLKFELGKELDLASGASAVVRYGNPRPYQDSSNPDETAPSDFSGTSQGGGSSSAL
jgi:hypothetical protein